MKQRLQELYERIKRLNVPYDFSVNREFEDLVTYHQNYWLMFPHPTVKDKDEGRSAPYPNIYVATDEENNIYVGISCDNNGAVENFEQLASKANQKSRISLLGLFETVSPAWKFVINRKTKVNHPLSSPLYSKEYTVTCNKISDELLSNILNRIILLRNTKLKPGDRYEGKRVCSQIPNLNLMAAIFKYKDETFDAMVKEIFEIFKVCIKILPKSETKKEEEKEKIRCASVLELENKINMMEEMKKKGSSGFKNLDKLIAKAKKERENLKGD